MDPITGMEVAHTFVLLSLSYNSVLGYAIVCMAPVDAFDQNINQNIVEFWNQNRWQNHTSTGRCITTHTFISF